MEDLEFTDVLIEYTVSTKYIRRKFDNVFISKDEYNDIKDIGQYLRKRIEKHIKKNRYKLIGWEIMPENDRIPF